MKQQLQQVIETALQTLQKQNILSEQNYNIVIEKPRDKQYGDFACNIALALAKEAKVNPRQLAEQIIAAIPATDFIEKISLAGPGFINFHLKINAWNKVVEDIFQHGERYGLSNVGKGERVHIEFVSSNPTGPLHVGHGRGAAYGAAVADLLSAVGYDVHREYYVNDGGRQMDILTTSVWLRYLQLQGEPIIFPSNGYQGDYVTEIATQIKKSEGDSLQSSVSQVFADIPPDEPQGGDKEIHIDALIARAKEILGQEKYLKIFNVTLEDILTDISEDLADFGVTYQQWFSERSLIIDNEVGRVLGLLKKNDHLYEKDGATWFRSTTFGDDKDRVMIRENGQPTYFAVDAAYRLSIMERGFSKLINILGSDHHGYVPRIMAVMKAMGFDPPPLTVLLVQFAVLYRGDERVQMSTRSGSFVTLRELREEVGKDAARFFYVMRRSEQHMDFDLELAKSESSDNPVYYVQYAHARICSVFRQLEEKKLQWTESEGIAALQYLIEPQEQNILAELTRYPEVVRLAALQYEPHLIAHYLKELAHLFHNYYNVLPFLVEDKNIRDARLALIKASRQVFANGLKLLGVSAPETM